MARSCSPENQPARDWLGDHRRRVRQSRKWLPRFPQSPKTVEDRVANRSPGTARWSPTGGLHPGRGRPARRGPDSQRLSAPRGAVPAASSDKRQTVTNPKLVQPAREIGKGVASIGVGRVRATTRRPRWTLTMVPPRGRFLVSTTRAPARSRRGTAPRQKPFPAERPGPAAGKRTWIPNRLVIVRNQPGVKWMSVSLFGTSSDWKSNISGTNGWKRAWGRREW
ncbi:MAG: hypothetical protein Ct9H300mP1_06580 [Planctomycetaceae bacterium]|nr:MAG: hypothetical protein Ct9H300mP1_06580 [Planctomycetaceae bacterium]